MNIKNFYLARPEDLPSSKEELFTQESISSEILKLKEKFLILALDQECLITAENALRRLSLDIATLTIITNDPNESTQNRDNDNSFNIIRVQGNTLAIVLHSTLCAYAGMLKEIISRGTNLNPEDWGKLRFAYYMIFQLLLDMDHREHSIISLKPSKNILSKDKNSGLDRWESGHYVFMTIIQAMIISFNCFKHESEVLNNIENARYYMNIAAILMHGAEAALKFAADFSTTSYEEEVRPTLSPPIAPPGMSGLYWRDHEYLLKKILLKMKPNFFSPNSCFTDLFQIFQHALAETYDAHKLVCTKFVGNNEPSLISRKPAGRVLENYKKNRLYIFNKKEEKV